MYRILVVNGYMALVSHFGFSISFYRSQDTFPIFSDSPIILKLFQLHLNHKNGCISLRNHHPDSY